MPTSRKRARTQQIPNASLLTQLLQSLRFPRCSTCDLDWFKDGGGVSNLMAQDKMSDAYLIPKCRTLIPLPRCNCSTLLLATSHNHIDSNIKRNINDGRSTASPAELKHILGLAERTELQQISKLLVSKFCYEDNLKSYSKLAMCRDCLETFVSTSNDVIEHDYKSETQPNVMFSVGGKCPVCRTKFSARAMSALVGEGSKLKNLDAEIEEWAEHVKTTIQFIGFKKKLRRILMSCKKPVSQSRYTNENMDTDSEPVDIECINEWLMDSEECPSDDCFSDIDDDITYSDHKENYCYKKKSKLTHVESAKGEIMEELLKRDPKFRQEQEDIKFIQEMSKTAEGRRILGIEEKTDLISNEARSQNIKQIEQDEKFAREIEKKQDEVDGKSVVKKSLLFGNHSRRKEPPINDIKKFMFQAPKQFASAVASRSAPINEDEVEVAAKGPRPDGKFLSTAAIGDDLNEAIEIFDSDQDSNPEREALASIAQGTNEVVPSDKDLEPQSHPRSRIYNLNSNIEMLDPDVEKEDRRGSALGESPSSPSSYEDSKPSSSIAIQQSGAKPAQMLRSEVERGGEKGPPAALSSLLDSPSLPSSSSSPSDGENRKSYASISIKKSSVWPTEVIGTSAIRSTNTNSDKKIPGLQEQNAPVASSVAASREGISVNTATTVQMMISMGFGKKESMQVLRETSFDADRAVNLLLNKRFKES